MQFWPYQRWGYRIAADQFVELEAPFALVGSHPRCQVQLEYSPRLPEVIYFAAIFADRVQVWPLCAIAFPMWGPIKPGKSLIIGKRKVEFIVESATQSWDASTHAPGEAINDVSELPGPPTDPPGGAMLLDWGDGIQVRKLSRAVTILGSDHPSVTRLHGLGLRTSELAMINVGTQIWAVQLNPASLGDSEPLIRELIPGSSSLWVGNLHIWADQTGDHSQSRFGSPQATEPEEAPTPPTEPTLTSPKQLPNSTAASTRNGRDSGQPVDVNELADTFTDRLLSKTSQRAVQESKIRWAISGGLLVFALLILAFIVVNGVLPIVRSIYSVDAG